MRGQTLSFSPAVGQTVIRPSHARTMARNRTRMTVDASPTLPANDAEPDAPVAQEDRYTNRELSWLSFNRRVLAEGERELSAARTAAVPVDLGQQSRRIHHGPHRRAGRSGQRGIETQAIDEASPRQRLAAIREQLLQLEDRQQACLDTLSALLAEEGIILAPVEALSDEQQGWLAAYFESDILPLITPQAIDPSHPFPFVANKGIGVIFRLKRVKRQADLIEMVLIPSGAPRFVRVPGEQAIYVAIEQLVTRFADQLFPGFKVLGDGVFRVLRDSDIEVEEEAEDLVRYFRTAIQRRRRGHVVLLELDEDCDGIAETLLREQLEVDEDMIVKSGGMLGLADLATICNEPRPDLKFTPFSPRYPERILEHDGDCFSAIREKDIVIHHPFESFDVVVDFLRQAARDPAVVSIKQTLYRAGDQSPVIAALMSGAGRQGGDRGGRAEGPLDEERNIHWASELERVGVQVIYGFTEWKTCQGQPGGPPRGRRLSHLLPFRHGHYPINAKIYTDLSFFTANAALGRDAAKLFNFITGYIEPGDLEHLALSPIGLQEQLFALIDAEIANAKAGKPAGIWVKLNSITYKPMIDKLYEASQAGVEIHAVVRGICSLRAGLPGVSDNIRVKSIIGRFLEHSRVWAFANGKALPSRQAKVYLTSADAMSRNLVRRVEVMVPITNKTVHDQVLGQVMLANILDTEQSWQLDPDGQYHRLRQGDGGFNCHQYFMANPSLSGRGAALAEHEVPRLTLRGADA